MRCFNILVGVNRKAVLGGRNAGEIFIVQSGTRSRGEGGKLSKEETRITQRPRIRRAECCLVDVVSLVTVPPLLEESFIPGEEELSAPVVEEKNKKKKERNEKQRFGWIGMEVHDPARLQPLWFTRGVHPCVSFCQPRVSRGQTMISRVIPSSISVSVCLSSMSAVTRWRGRNIVDEISRRAAIFFSRIRGHV